LIERRWFILSEEKMFYTKEIDDLLKEIEIMKKQINELIINQDRLNESVKDIENKVHYKKNYLEMFKTSKRSITVN